jgi:hypothetical protein
VSVVLAPLQVSREQFGVRGPVTGPGCSEGCRSEETSPRSDDHCDEVTEVLEVRPDPESRVLGHVVLRLVVVVEEE